MSGRANWPIWPYDGESEQFKLDGENMGDLKARFDRFDKENPQIWKKFREMAHKIRKTGRSRYGAWTIIQVIRWESDLNTRCDDFKINNDFVALYARKLAAKDPSWIKFFGLREMKRS